jgi:hypothetical protein
VLATFSVVEFTNGIVRVSKLNTVLVEFEVKPAVTRFVVVIVLLTVRLAKLETRQTFIVPTLAVVANRFVVKESRLEIEITFRVEMLAVVPNRFAKG